MRWPGEGTRESTDLTPFLRHLEARDRDAAAFAAELSATPGWSVVSMIGPVQMDVWELLVEGGGWTVRFGVERGYSDGILATNPATGERLRLTGLDDARAWLALGARPPSGGVAQPDL